MKNRNDGENQERMISETAKENVSGSARIVTGFNDSSKELLTPETDRKATANKKDNTRMNGSDFRYFYSGRKLL